MKADGEINRNILVYSKSVKGSVLQYGIVYVLNVLCV